MMLRDVFFHVAVRDVAPAVRTHGATGHAMQHIFRIESVVARTVTLFRQFFLAFQQVLHLDLRAS